LSVLDLNVDLDVGTRSEVTPDNHRVPSEGLRSTKYINAIALHPLAPDRLRPGEPGSVDGRISWLDIFLYGLPPGSRGARGSARGTWGGCFWLTDPEKLPLAQGSW